MRPDMEPEPVSSIGAEGPEEACAPSKSRPRSPRSTRALSQPRCCHHHTASFFLAS